MESRVAGVTVRRVDPEMGCCDTGKMAVIVVVPVVIEVDIPLEPAALLMAATVVTDELQVTDAVRSCVVLSE